MKILINIILVTVLVLVWGMFYKRNISKKNISKKSKFITIVIIVAFNLTSIYMFNLSSKKSYFTEFKGIEISLQLANIEEFLTDKKDTYKSLMKTDTVKLASELLLKHKFNYNPKVKKGIKLRFSDSISYENKKKVYLLKLLFIYPINNEEKELETYFVIKDTKNISYQKIISIYERILNELLKSVFFEDEIKDKSPEELVSLLRYKHNLPNINYIHLFNALLKLDDLPKLPDKVLLRFLNKPSTFSEATGYAILTNHCSVINKIIDKSVYFNNSALETLLSIIIQSKCTVVKGYLTVLSSSSKKSTSRLAKKYFDIYKKSSKKEITYKNGKRIEVK